MDKPRVRFAPSPTGYLHIGGARTALFNWLWARKTGGTFILRIEDTDQARNTRESIEAIFDAMRWLGLDWDEGPQHPDDEGGGAHAPYFQMKRLGIYAEHAERLIRAGKAYRCYCTREELDELKSKLPPKQREGFRYPGTCRERTDQPDKPYVVRFKSPTEGVVRFDDLVFGELSTPNSAQTDFVLLRSDGVPLYNFGAVVDDVTMGVTLVARGRDHIVNTAPQILLYRAFDYPLPQFAHLPMMMANKSEKLSKRHGAVSVTEYRDKGWAPEGLLSYLVRFGWSYGDEELFTLRSLVEKFDWSRVNKADGIYDWRKCGAINSKYVAQLAPDAEVTRGAARFLRERGFDLRDDDSRLAAALPHVRPRAEVKVPGARPGETPPLPPGPYAVIAEGLDWLFRDEPVMDASAAEKFFTADAAPRLRQIADVVDAITDWSEATVRSALEAWLAREGLEIKTVAQPARVALTGRSTSPGLYEVIALLGRERAVARLRRAADGASGTAA